MTPVMKTITTLLFVLVLLALDNDMDKAGYTIRRGYASVDAETGENRFRLWGDAFQI